MGSVVVPPAVCWNAKICLLACVDTPRGSYSIEVRPVGAVTVTPYWLDRSTVLVMMTESAFVPVVSTMSGAMPATCSALA